jgi:hypothetical protein
MLLKSFVINVKKYLHSNFHQEVRNLLQEVRNFIQEVRNFKQEVRNIYLAKEICKFPQGICKEIFRFANVIR